MLSRDQPVTVILECCNRERITEPLATIQDVPPPWQLKCRQCGSTVAYDPVEYLRLVDQRTGPYEITVRQVVPACQIWCDG